MNERWQQLNDRWQQLSDRWQQMNDRWQHMSDRWQQLNDRWQQMNDRWQQTSDVFRQTSQRSILVGAGRGVPVERPAGCIERPVPPTNRFGARTSTIGNFPEGADPRGLG